MRKIVLMLALGLSFLSFGQLNLVEVSAEEIDILGYKALSGRNVFASATNYYTKEEVSKCDLKNTMSFLLEFKYKDKSLAKYFIYTSRQLGEGKTYYSIPNPTLVGMCFETKNFPQDLLFQMAKTNRWTFITNDEGEFTYISSGGDASTYVIFRKDGYDKVCTLNHIDLPGGEKIETVLYKVMK